MEAITMSIYCKYLRLTSQHVASILTLTTQALPSRPLLRSRSCIPTIQRLGSLAPATQTRRNLRQRRNPSIRTYEPCGKPPFTTLESFSEPHPHTVFPPATAMDRTPRQKGYPRNGLRPLLHQSLRPLPPRRLRPWTNLHLPPRRICNTLHPTPLHPPSPPHHQPHHRQINQHHRPLRRRPPQILVTAKPPPNSQQHGHSALPGNRRAHLRSRRPLFLLHDLEPHHALVRPGDHAEDIRVAAGSDDGDADGVY